MSASSCQGLWERRRGLRILSFQYLLRLWATGDRTVDYEDIKCLWGARELG